MRKLILITLIGSLTIAVAAEKTPLQLMRAEIKILKKDLKIKKMTLKLDSLRVIRDSLALELAK